MKEQAALERGMIGKDHMTVMTEVYNLIQEESRFGLDVDAATGAWLMLPSLLAHGVAHN